LTGKEQFNINIREGSLQVNEQLAVTTNTGKTFNVKVRLDTDVEIEYFKNGGILHYVLRRLAKA
jgi:aconitate hydratase